MPSYLLALNCGSSSLKTTLFSYPSLEVLATLSASSIGSDSATLKVKRKGSSSSTSSSSPSSSSVKGESHSDIFGDVLKALTSSGNGKSNHKLIESEQDIKIVTHRIVHGGTLDGPVEVSKGHTEALKRMEQLSAFAPLHNHHAVLTVRAVLDKLPEAKNYLCFDTLFHRSLPKHIYTYPIEQPKHEPPVPLRRYGFHGLSYSSILKQVAPFLEKSKEETNVIICHLGSGASMCVIKNGKSLDTTMGLTPLEGLMGGTRSGSLDPSLTYHLYDEPSKSGELQEIKGMKISRGELVLNKQSGFVGLCGTNEFADISEKAAQQEKDGKEGKELLAVRIFENRILNYIGSYLVHLRNQPDAIIFSGGIGEKSASLRSSILEQLDYLGIEIDDDKNESAGSSDEPVVLITSQNSKVKALRVLTDEERECAELAKEHFGETI